MDAFFPLVAVNPGWPSGPVNPTAPASPEAVYFTCCMNRMMGRDAEEKVA